MLCSLVSGRCELTAATGKYPQSGQNIAVRVMPVCLARVSIGLTPDAPAHAVRRNELIQPGAKRASKETQAVAGTFRSGRMLAMLRGPTP